jgi:hypothetical protein
MTSTLSRDLFDVLGAAIQTQPAGRAVGLELEPELGGDHHLIANRSEGFADKLLVHVRAVSLGGVEEVDTAFDGRPDQGDHLRLVLGRAIGNAHSHAAEPDGRNFQAALSKFAFLHLLILSDYSALRDAISMAKRYFTSDLRSRL